MARIRATDQTVLRNFYINISRLKHLVMFLALLVATPSWAQDGADEAKARLDGIKILENNQLPLLDNRFRIDSEVKEITLLFFRERGTPPVILVRPDGSKMYATMAITGQADWFDEPTYDLIRIKNPMPGPWQAVGQLAEGSKVLIITDFELNVDDLPQILIQGETIKLTGYVSNNGEPIKARNFKDVINLDVDFVSTNDEAYTNFGAGVVEVTSFVDDGKGYDERPRDGVFTGEFVLSFPAGQWIPKYHVQTPLMTRELEHDPVIVHPNPVQMSIETTEDPNGFHVLTIDVVGDYIKPESVVFQGKIFYPNQEVQSFSITENIAESRKFNVINYDYGIYRIEISAFGENANGREFMLAIPDFTFAIDPPPIEETRDPRLQYDADGNPIIETPPEDLEPEPEPVDYTGLIIAAVFGNLFIILLAFLLVRKFVHGKNILPAMNFSMPSFSFLKRKRKDDDEEDEKADSGKKSSDGEFEDLTLD